MDNNKVLDMLSELECEFYYRADGSNDRHGVSFVECQEMHDKINELLIKWHNLTGEVLK